jgi:hypothetical protein
MISIEERKIIFKDVLKYVTIGLGIHIMRCVIDGEEILSQTSLKLLLYMVVSIIAYHIGIKKRVPNAE